MAQGEGSCGDLLPASHPVDGGYVDEEHLATSRQVHGIDPVGRAPADTT